MVLSFFSIDMDHHKKEPVATSSSSQYRKRLASLTTHLRKYEKPKPNGYDVFATSYISGDIPWKTILQEEFVTSAGDLPPFTPRFEVGYLAVQEEERKLRGESIRKQDILACSQDIAQHFKEACSAEVAERDRNQHLAYLYFKAMQYSTVNKAQALDEKYPKPHCDVVRSTYSREHQAAIAATIWEKEKSVEATLQRKERQLVKLPNVIVSRTGGSVESRGMATEKDGEDLVKLRKSIRAALGSPMIMRDMKLSEEHWQFKAKAERKRGGEQSGKKRKFLWKRNVYPPKTREERIAELRAKAPPLEPQFLETDNLPGVWKPELMIETFKTAYVEAKEREKEDLIVVEDDWTNIFHTNKKCLDWLKSIPDSL